MSGPTRRPWLIALVAGAGAVAAAITIFTVSGPSPKGSVEIRAPELSAEAQAGRRLFERHCAACHGDQAAGAPTGPPLVHRIYHPGHHGDVAFEFAVRRGVRAHHWTFGDMPPVPAVPPDEIALITRYVRELQRAHGIY